MPNKPNQVAITPELIDYQPTIEDMSVVDRNKAIIAERILDNTRSIDLAEKYNLSKAMVCRIIQQSAGNANIQAYIDHYWQKRVIDSARHKVLAILESINPKKLPEGQKATSIGILIDKVRLLQGQATEIKEVRSLDMAELLKVLR